MKRHGRWAIACAVAVPLVVTCVAGCSTARMACDCVEQGITINVPADIASSVTGVHLSGAACAGVTPTCTNQTNGCTTYRFTPVAAGSCSIEVDLSGRAFTDQVTIVAESGCCAGFYASPISAAQVDVPASGAGDAG